MDETPVTEIHIGKRCRIDYLFTKPDGTQGPIDGPPEIETTDPAVIVPLDNGDQRSFYARCVGAGTASVILSADVDLGAGVKRIERAFAFRGVDVMASQVQATVGGEEDDPDFDGENHTDPLPAPEPSEPQGGGVPSGTGEPPPAGSTADQGGTAAPSGAGDAGPTPPAQGDPGASQEPRAGGGEGPEVGTAPVAGT